MRLLNNFRFRVSLIDVIATVLELSVSLAMGVAISVLILTLFNYPATRCLSIMFSTGFNNVGYLLNIATPLIATALAFTIPMHAGLFNIGAEGQLYIGALASLTTSVITGNPVLAIVAGMLAGLAMGLAIGVLRVYRGVNEVVSSIMFNWILYYLTIFLLTYYLYDPVIPHQSVSVPSPARLTSIRIEGVEVGLAFVLMFIVAIIADIVVYHTDVGYSIRVLGYSVRSAKYAGIDVGKVQLIAMALGGAFSGLGGALYLQGYVHAVDVTMSALYGLGYTGIGVAFLGRLHPLGVVASSIFISGLTIGGQIMELRTGVPPEVADVILGVVVASLALSYAYRTAISVIKSRMRLERT